MLHRAMMTIVARLLIAKLPVQGLAITQLAYASLLSEQARMPELRKGYPQK